ncbi:MAG: PaaI family thioesterase [Alphaproteobacteria bacterium]
MEQAPSTFCPKDPDYAERVRASFARQSFMAHLGAELAEVGPGRCTVSLLYREEFTQQHKHFHGGVIGTLADNAAGYAAFSLMPAESTILTVEYKLNFVAPGRGERLIARGLVLRPGRTLSVARAEVYALKDGEERLCATALETLMCLPGKPDRASAG